ncbi:MAG: hypothetical protein ACK5DC_02615 [Burkholderiales bacterium]
MGSLLHNETRSIPRPMANTNDDVEVERAQNVQIGLALKLLAAFNEYASLGDQGSGLPLDTNDMAKEG